MNVSLRQLRAFQAVADASSFTEAARRLHLTQSALSVLVRELERELGVRLLDRHTRQVQLTDAGREFLPHVLRTLQELDTAVASVSQLRDKKRGSLRVAAPQLMACTLMPRVIGAYAREYPDIRVTLIDTLPEQMLARLQAGEVELAVGPDIPPEPDIEREALARDRHWLICPPEHPLAQRPRVTWRELHGHPLIAPTRDFVARVMPELLAHSRELSLRPAHEVSYMTTALGMVQAGLGVTVCPTYSAPLVRAYGLRMRPLEEPVFWRDVCLYTSARKSLSPAARSFLDFLEAFVRREEGGAGADRWSAPLPG